MISIPMQENHCHLLIILALPQGRPVVENSGDSGLYGTSYLPCSSSVCTQVEIEAGDMLVIGAYIDDPSTPVGFATLEVSGNLRLHWDPKGEPAFRGAGSPAA